MNCTADTSFFMRLSEGSEKAARLWEDITQGKSRLIVPTAVLVELKKQYAKKGMQKEADELISAFERSSRITILPLTTELAKKAGNISYTYNLTNFDAVIITTAIETGFVAIPTSDPLFLRAQKDEKITVVPM